MATHDTPDDERAVVKLLIHPGEASVEEIQSLLQALSDLHVMAGGLGLIFRVEGNSVLMAERELA